MLFSGLTSLQNKKHLSHVWRVLFENREFKAEQTFDVKLPSQNALRTVRPGSVVDPGLPVDLQASHTGPKILKERHSTLLMNILDLQRKVCACILAWVCLSLVVSMPASRKQDFIGKGNLPCDATDASGKEVVFFECCSYVYGTLCEKSTLKF